MQQCRFHSNLQDSKILIFTTGGLAQLARASALHAEGQGFDSLILHQKKKYKSTERENKKIKTNKHKTEVLKILE